MKKNFTVNISGILFHIDDDAYTRLQSYLEQLKAHFKNTAGKEEIISDIETRIAEMMQARLDSSKQVITIVDINEIVKTMGEPSDFDSDETEEEIPNKQKKSYGIKTAKRFYRDRENRVLAGVAGGIGAYFGMDPLWARLAFIISSFFGGTGVFIYIILWAIIPEAKTTAQKLEMRGEPVNIDNIEKSIEGELNSIGDKLNELKDKHFKKKSSPNIFEKIGNLIIQIISGLFRLVRITLGAAFAIIAFVFIILFIVSLFSNNDFFLSHMNGPTFISLPKLMELVYISSSEVNLVLTGISIVVLVPLIGILYTGAKGVFGIDKKIPNMGITLFIIWLTGIVLLGISASQTSQYFDTQQTQSLPYEKGIEADTLFLRLAADTSSSQITSSLDLPHAVDARIHFYHDNANFYSVPEIRIRESRDENYHYLIKKSARGSDLSDANSNLENITFQVQLHDNELSIPPYYQYPKQDKWRKQELKLYIYVPKGKTIQYIPHNEFDNDFMDAVDRHYNYLMRYNHNYDNTPWPEEKKDTLPVIDSIPSMDSTQVVVCLEDVLIPSFLSS